MPPARVALARNFPFLGRRVPVVALLLAASAAALATLFFLQRLQLVVSSTSIFLASYAAATAVGFLLYFRWVNTAVSASTNSTRKTYPVAYAIGVVLASTAALWILWNSHVGISPTFAFFVAIACALIGIQIITYNHQRSCLPILVQILGVGLLLRFAPYYLNTYVYASDTYFHFTIVDLTIANGVFEGLGPYIAYPGYHVFNAMALQLTGLPTTSFAIINLIALALSPLLVFAIGRRFISRQVGLLAALFLVFSNFFFPSAFYSPTFLGIVTLLTAILALILAYATARRVFWIGFWVASIATLVFHPINFLVLVMVLSGAFLARLGRQVKGNAAGVPVWSAAVIFVAYMVYISIFLFEDILVKTFETGGAPLTPNASSEVSILSLYTLELSYGHLGVASKGIFFVPGALMLLSGRNFWKNWPGLTTLILIALPFLGFLGGLLGPLQLTRFLLYIDVFIVIPVAFFLVRFAVNSVRGRRKVVVGGIVFGLAFLSLTSYLTVDTEGFMTNAVPRDPLFIDEAGLAARDILLKLPPGSTLAMDFGSRRYLAATDPVRGPYQLPTLTIENFPPEEDFDGFVAISFTLTDRMILTLTGPQKVDARNWVAEKTTHMGYNRIFDSGTFVVLLGGSST